MRLATAALLALLPIAALAQPVDPALRSAQWYDVTDDGHRSYVYELGRARAAGDTVIVLHGGWGAEHGYLVDAFRPVADAHRLVFYDQRGSLRSPAPDSTITLARLVADLESLRGELGVERVTLAAHSMGNALAYAYLGAHPERVRGLALVGPVLPGPFPADSAFLARVAPALSSDSLDAARGRFELDLVERVKRHRVAAGLVPDSLLAAPAVEVYRMRDAPGWSDRQRTDAWRIAFTAVNTCDGANWRAMQGGQVFYAPEVASAVLSDPAYAEAQARFLPDLLAFGGPVRVVIGTCDYVDLGPAVWPALAPQLGDGALAVVEGAGHSLWMDRPEAFARALRAALEDATR